MSNFVWFYTTIVFVLYLKLKQTGHSFATNLTKHFGVGKDWPETEVPTPRHVLRNSLLNQKKGVVGGCRWTKDPTPILIEDSITKRFHQRKKIRKS